MGYGNYNEMQRFREETRQQTIVQYEKKREIIDGLLTTIHDESDDITERKNALQRLVNEFGDPDRISTDVWIQLNRFIKLIRRCEEDINIAKSKGEFYLTEDEIAKNLLQKYQEVSDAIENSSNYGKSLRSIPIDGGSFPSPPQQGQGNHIVEPTGNTAQIPENSIISPAGDFDKDDGEEA